MTNFAGSRKRIKRVKKELREAIEKEVYRSLSFKGAAMIYPLKSRKMTNRIHGMAVVDWKNIRKIIKYYD